jgi:tRNA threonylcarbamoyladenosine biosynthesis protein TsaB
VVEELAEYNISGSEEPLQILSLDTTSRAGSIAVLQDDRLIAEITGDPALPHGQRLPGDLNRALEQAGVRIEDVDLLAVAAGPGSFTGLRIGIASMQGLAFARSLKIVPVSTLEALAHEIERDAGEGELIAPWVDAQRGEVFATLYGAGLRATLAPASAASADVTLQLWRAHVDGARVTFAGDGAVRYKDAIVAALGDRASVWPQVPLLAGAVARIAAAGPARAVLPHAVIPIYVRRPDVELTRERGTTPP